MVALGSVEAHQAEFSLRGQTVGQELRLQPSDLVVVKTNVKVQVAIGDQAVVGQHGNAGLMRHANGFGHGRAVVRHDDQDVHLPADQRLHVGDLAGVIAVGRLNQDLGAQFPGPLHKEVAVLLKPLLLQRVHRKTDEDTGAAASFPGAADLL